MSDFPERGVEDVDMTDMTVVPESLAGACRVFAAGPALERAPDTERWWSVVQAAMGDAASGVPRQAALPKQSLFSRTTQRTRWFWPAAAVAAVVAGIVVTTLPQSAPRSMIPSIGTGSVYTTVGGQRARVSLSDGSFVTLAPNSRLKVTNTFGAGSRAVVLNGEAVFTVSQISGAPFVVRTGNVATTVLGTTFAVRQYASDTMARVVVAEGRVGVEGGQVLNAGDVALVDDRQITTVRRSADIGPYFGWTAGHLTFRDVPADEVLMTLERWYSVKLTVRDASLLRDRLTLALDNASEQEMINVVALALGATHERAGSTITFLRPSAGEL